MRTSKADVKRMMVVKVEEKKRVSSVMNCAAGGSKFSINFGWPLRVVGGEGHNPNGRMPLKNSKIECR